MGLAQGGNDALAFAFPEGHPGEDGCRGSTKTRQTALLSRPLDRAGPREFQVKAQVPFLRQDERAFHDVLQLTHVAGPIVRLQLFHLVSGERGKVHLQAPRRRPQEVRCQQGNVFPALPQRGHFDWKHAEPVI
jgi:hypothetical protein